MIQLIPAIDLQQGQCVRLRQGRFDEVRFYPQSPTDLARHYASQDFQRLHVVDLDGARQGQIQQLALIQTLRQTGLTLQVGGGIRSLAAAQFCLEAGIRRIWTR
jgi:phosphoribosylformimino-5-aminoimidazole carboxamide ribotide isomerase